MDDPSIAEKLVESLARPDGSPKLRPVHAIGIGATGHFVASDVARDYCVAEHFQGEKIDVTGTFFKRFGQCNSARRLVRRTRNGDTLSPRRRRRD